MSSFSSFDLAALQATAGGKFTQEELINMVRFAENAERYEDMCQFMRLRVENFKDSQLSVEERNLLSVAYKNVISSRRAAWRQLQAETESSEAPEYEKYKSMIETELEMISQDILGLLDTLIKEDSTDVEEQVFYLKMAGDYYRYLTETMNSEEYKNKTKDYYERASARAVDLPPTQPIRLGLALNFSVCYYEILKDEKAACDLAKEAFDQAISKLDELSECDYKDSTLIMQLLRDNLTLWTSSPQEDVHVEDLDE